MLFSINLNQWENLSSDLSPNHLIKIDSKLYGSNQGGFFIYDLDDESFALNNHQNCLEVSSIAADNNSLWVLCENGTIYKNNSSLIVNHLNLDDAHDFIISDQAIYVIYENNNIYGIADFSFDSSSLVYNDYYESFTASNSEEFKSIVVLDDFIYLLTDSALYYADTNANLKFSSNWNLLSNINHPLDIVSFNNKLIFIYPDSLNVFDINNGSELSEINSIAVEWGNFINQSVGGNILTILGSEKIVSISNDFNIVGEYIGDFNNTSCIYSDLDNIYLGAKNQGFWVINEEIVKCSPNTLLSHDIEALYYNNEKLYGISRDGLFIYNQTNFFNLLSDRDQSSFLTSDYSNDCNMFNGFQLDYIPGSKVSSSIVAYDNRIFLPNSGIIPSEEENRGGFIIVNESDFTIEDIIGESQLEGLNGIYDSNTDNYLTINQIKKDQSNRIWVVNPYAEQSGSILSYLNLNDNSWTNIQAPDQQSYLPQEIAFDNSNRAWVAFRNETKLINSEIYSNGGLKIVMPDGHWYLVENLESLPGEDSNVSIWSIDFSTFQGNEILWVLTSNGVQGYSVTPSLNGDFFNNDPSDDYLFRIDRIYPLDFFTNVSFSKGDKIKIDPQGNTWITTAHSGIYVIKNNIDFWPNSDGINVYNSDVLSNVVRDVAFDAENGLAFIATDKGLSILGVPFEKNRKNSNIGVSPNPFVVGQDTNIVIEDIYSGSLIKIITLSGKVVQEIQLPYNENKINWDGTDHKGRFLDSGIYLIVAQSDRYGNGVTKIAIIR